MGFRIADSSLALQSFRKYVPLLAARADSLSKKLSKCIELDFTNQKQIIAYQAVSKFNEELLELADIEVQTGKDNLKIAQKKIKWLNTKVLILEVGVVTGAGWLVWRELK